MKYIEVKPESLSILRKSIIAIERRDEVFTNIYTEASTFESELPYRVIIDMLESSESDGSLNEMAVFRQMNNSLKTLVDNSQIFGG